MEKIIKYTDEKHGFSFINAKELQQNTPYCQNFNDALLNDYKQQAICTKKILPIRITDLNKAELTPLPSVVSESLRDKLLFFKAVVLPPISTMECKLLVSVSKCNNKKCNAIIISMNRKKPFSFCLKCQKYNINAIDKYISLQSFNIRLYDGIKSLPFIKCVWLVTSDYPHRHLTNNDEGKIIFITGFMKSEKSKYYFEANNVEFEESRDGII